MRTYHATNTYNNTEYIMTLDPLGGIKLESEKSDGFSTSTYISRHKAAQLLNLWRTDDRTTVKRWR